MLELVGRSHDEDLLAATVRALADAAAAESKDAVAPAVDPSTGGVVGGDEADALRPDLARRGFADIAVLTDDDGDVRGVDATWAGQGRTDRTDVPG